MRAEVGFSLMQGLCWEMCSCEWDHGIDGRRERNFLLRGGDVGFGGAPCGGER